MIAFASRPFVGTLLLAALLAPGVATIAHAQADGATIALPGPAAPPPASIAPNGLPGAPLMNDLHERMKQMQAAGDPLLRRKLGDEFLKTLQQGMANVGRPAAPAGR